MHEGYFNLQTFAAALLGYMSDDDCKQFAEMNDIALFPEEDEEVNREDEFLYDERDE